MCIYSTWGGVWPTHGDVSEELVVEQAEYLCQVEGRGGIKAHGGTPVLVQVGGGAEGVVVAPRLLRPTAAAVCSSNQHQGKRYIV